MTRGLRPRSGSRQLGAPTSRVGTGGAYPVIHPGHPPGVPLGLAGGCQAVSTPRPGSVGAGRRSAERAVRSSSSKPEDLERAGVVRVPRTEGTAGGQPGLADGRLLQGRRRGVGNGFQAHFSRVDLPVFGSSGNPFYRRVSLRRHRFVLRGSILSTPSPQRHSAGSAGTPVTWQDVRRRTPCHGLTGTAPRSQPVGQAVLPR